MAERRFPPPWTFEEANNACFVVKDANGFAVSYVYYECEPGRRTAANLITSMGCPGLTSPTDFILAKVCAGTNTARRTAILNS